MRPSSNISFKNLKTMFKNKSISKKPMLFTSYPTVRYLNTSSLNTDQNSHTIDKEKPTEAPKPQLNPTATSTLGFYGATILSYIQEPLKDTATLANKYYQFLNNSVKTSSNEQVVHVNPISLKTTKNQNLMIPKPINLVQKKSIEKTVEDKVLHLCDSIEKATSFLVKSALINDLFKTLYENPDDLRDLIYRKKRNIIKNLLTLREKAYKKEDKIIYGNINQCLALLGYVDQSSVKHHGINILSLDGGGAKGFVTIEVLKNIEKLCGKPIHEIFDYICGTSTGAVLAALLGIYKMPLDEIEKQYRIFVKEIFQQNRAAGIGNLVMSYAYYDTAIWEAMLKEAMGDTLVINSAKNKNSCKISMISNVTTPNQMKIFLFRNYNLPSWAQSHYDGTCRHKVWEAVRASSAAPGYYEDFKIDGYVFHDGGLLANNPTAIALHEVKHLWPSQSNNCIVSIGNGRYKPGGYLSTKAESISLKQKINRIVSGISCTETVHTMLLDLLPTKLYFRFNPYLSEEFHLDENRPLKWRLMQYETNMYMRRNKYKFEMAAKQLLRPKTSVQQINELLKEKYNCTI